MHHRETQKPQLADVYVPLNLRDPKAFAAFSKELVNAVTCCEAVEQGPWTPRTALEILQKAERKRGHATVWTVSLPSEGCSQRFRVFSAKEDGHTTYIIAFRSDEECYNDIVKKSEEFSEVENDNNFQVHKALWWRAATMPLRSLPPQWRSELREGRHRLILTGFSVGGAVAALATLQLLEAEDPDLREQICCYTFGTPLQGDQNYANCINQKYASNFYHVMLDGDPIPGILTLVSKVAENQPQVCSDVVKNIWTVLALVAKMAAIVVLETTVAPGVGAILQQIDFVKLGRGIESLIMTERDSRMPLPEYKFGGSLVLLDRQQSYNGMRFVPLLGDGRVLEGIFCVEERNVTSSDLGSKLDVHQIKKFYQVINDLDNSYINHVIKNASLENPDSWTSSKELSQRLDDSFFHVNEMVKDGAGRVAKSTTSVAKSAFNVATSHARCITTQPNYEDDPSSSRLGSQYLLQPHFDMDKPIKVWLDKHDNITIEVYGKNMVLGIHVLYLRNHKEVLRVPCTEYMLHWVENSQDSQKSVKETLANLPLQFNTQGIKGLSFDEPDGYFRVQLAFGFIDVPASQVEKSWFDALDVLCVAERFATLQPTKLIDCLIFWGMATAQAVCTEAFYAIQEHPKYADDTVKKTLDELRHVPDEFLLLDRLLVLFDTSQFPLSVLNKLPPEMSATLRNTTNASKANLIVPYFSADNESANWTFSGCYTRTVKRMITKEMLSKKETAEQLSKSLNKELEGPKEMVLAFLGHRFEYKAYAKNFSFSHINGWNKEMRIAKATTGVSAKGGLMLPIINVPILYAGEALDNKFLVGLGAVIGVPTALLTAGLVGGAWWLYYAVSSPIRMFQKRPGLMDEWQSSKLSADNWEKKLQAAALLFNCKIKPPYVACKWEFELYQLLKNRIPEAGCFNFSTLDVKKARYAAVTALQLANYALAGARLYEIRKHLTERKTALGLMGCSQAGKSTFASLAFNVDSQPGAGINRRTRVLRHWTLTLPLTAGRNRQFTLIDFPGSTDYAAKEWYIRGQLLTSVIVVVLRLDEINTEQGVTLIEKACKARRQDKEVHILLCFTKADEVYCNYEDEAMADQRRGKGTTAAQLFTKNFEYYKKELLDSASEAAGDADQLAYVSANMHACCFRPTLQDQTLPLVRELKNVNVKNVEWVKRWCLDKLLSINSSRSHSGTF